LLVAAFTAGCGSGSSSKTSASTGTVTLTMTDPPTCSAPQGPFSHVYVTVTDVQINQSSTAGSNDSSWVDLTPSLKSAPQQIDLFGQATSQCFLAQLGVTQIPAGTYQQVRVILADNSITLANNNCKTAGVNCVVLASNPTQPQELALSSESQTGIKIPSGQIAGGQYTVGAGSSTTFNIDFNACASIVVEPNGTYRLKPVLHAGEINTSSSSSINGVVVDAATTAPITGTVLVALEQKDSAGVDRVVMETKADATGAFVFCPVPAGSYDLVSIGVASTGASYAATVTQGVGPGTNVGNIPINAVVAANTADATITGQVTTANSSGAATGADVAISALQQLTSGMQVTVPLVPQVSSTVNLTTQAGTSCPTNTDCAAYSINVPAAEPYAGTFATSGTTYAQVAGSPAYMVSALAFVTGSGGTADCTVPSQATTPVSVTAAISTAAPTLTFTGCQ